MDKHMEVVINKHGLVAAPVTPQLFGNAGREHMEKYGEIFMTVNKLIELFINKLFQKGRY